MTFKQGSIHNAEDIARIYIAAFPESITFFFGNKSESKLLAILTSAFAFLLLTGSQVMLASKSGKIIGYCIFSAKRTTSSKIKMLITNFFTIAKIGLSILSQIHLGSIIRLVYNGILLRFNTKTKQTLLTKGASIDSIAISPIIQGQGIGSKLMQVVLDILKDEHVYLNVRPENTAAKQLYLSNGFQPYGITKDLLGEWIMMVHR